MPAEIELQKLGNAGLDSLIPGIVGYATHIQTILPFYSDQASPLVTHCLYCTAKRLIGVENARAVRTFTLIKETLYKLRSKWMVAGKQRSERFSILANNNSGEYLKILEDIESSISIPGRVYA